MVRSSDIENGEALRFLRLRIISSRRARDLNRTKMVGSCFDFAALFSADSESGFVERRTKCAASISSTSIFCAK